MESVPKRQALRIKNGLKKYKKILQRAKAKDINESDTVLVITDMLAEVFGYEKYLEITSEYAIKSTYCDLAIKENDKVIYLIECKAIGVDLREPHVHQALSYAANEGIEWVILTNGQHWRVYKVAFEKPIRLEELFFFDLFDIDLKDSNTIEKLFALSKEAVRKNKMKTLHQEMQLMNKFTIAAVIQSEEVMKTIAKELKNLSKGAKVNKEIIDDILLNDILKRDVIESDEAKLALSRYKRSAGRKVRKKNELERTTITSSIVSLGAPEVATDVIESAPSI